MSAYQEWLQKQERKVVRRPVTSPQSSIQAFRASIAAQAALETDLAEASDAYKAWLQRREARLAAVEQVVEKETPKRNSKEIIADAVGKYTLLAKMAADSKKRPLPKATSSAAATRVSGPAAAPPAKVPTAPSANAKAPESKNSTDSYWEKLIGDAPMHRRKRGIGDVEAPSKLSSVPHKQRKKVHEETKHEDNSSSSSSSNSERSDIAIKIHTKKPTPLDEALAKLDKKYGALVTLQDFSPTSNSSTVNALSEPQGIQEVHYWNDVDRFASLN